MSIMYPIYKQWNRMFFETNIIDSSDAAKHLGKRFYSFRKHFEFRTKLPNNLKPGDKVYIYEPKKYGGSGMIIGEFTVGQIIPCSNYRFGATEFIEYFCRNVLKSEDYAQKFKRMLDVEDGHYKGSNGKYALDPESADFIAEFKTWPRPETYIFNAARVKNIESAECIWRLCDEYLKQQGFYNEFGESCYKYALEVTEPVQYSAPKKLSEFKKLDGSIIEKAPQSFVYVEAPDIKCNINCD